MIQHVYLAVICNSPGCTTGCVLKYLGPHWGEKEFGDLVPEWFDFQCGECHRTHRYKREEVYPVITEESPPSGFENAF
jgi:hypothetical protein